jgi:hypothetical protein
MPSKPRCVWLAKSALRHSVLGYKEITHPGVRTTFLHPIDLTSS